jgi:spore germination cell wall hydrolase CwlJ-like protein
MTLRTHSTRKRNPLGISRKWVVKVVLTLVVLAAITSPLFATNTASRDERCLAEVVYREANGEPLLGKIAVAQVVLNRTNHQDFPSTICKVVFEKNQFSWTKGWNGRFKYNQQSLQAARLVITGDFQLEDFNALWFHNKSVKPKWSKKLKLVKKIKNHYFYA